MRAELIVKTNAQLVTCASNGRAKRGDELHELDIIDRGAVAVVDKLIKAVGPADDILRKYSSDKTVDVGDKIIIPGLVDPHTHIVYGGNRLAEFEQKISGADYLEILANGGGILSTVENTRKATFQSLVETGRSRLDKMLACGTTTAEIKTGYGLDLETELKMLRVIERLDRTHLIDIVPTFLAAHAVPVEYRSNARGYVDLICNEMLGQAGNWYKDSHFPNQNVPFFIDVFCEKNAFDLEQSKRILSTAASFGFQIKAHVDEFSNLGGSRLAIGLGAASVDHLDAISEDEIALLAASDTIGVITPTVNFNLGSQQFANARKLIDSGCAIALSTDYNPGSAPCPAQPMTMAIACRYQKLSPAEALNAATINAAFAVRLGDRIGSLEPGKQADFVVLNTNDYRDIAYEFGGPKVEMIFKNGKAVVIEESSAAYSQ